MKTLCSAAATLLLLSSFMVQAAVTRAPFSEERFEAPQARDVLVLVDVWARWCPTCAAQKKILDRAAQ